jgi:hypothetical protein
LSSKILFGRQFFAWTTDEQGLALRQDRALFTRSAGAGAPFTLLNDLANPTADEMKLASGLSSAFQFGRYAWPEPWATRMGSPGQDPGGQLLRIVIKPEAWLVIVEGRQIWVFDAEQQVVTAADALAHPERVGAIYFDSAYLDPNGCGSIGVGEREFLLGNLAMVEEWSIGTQPIADRINANIAQLTRFLENSRSCPVTSDAFSWTQSVLCSWASQVGGAGQAGASGFDPSATPGGAGAGGFPSKSEGVAGMAGAPTPDQSAPFGFNPVNFSGLQANSTEEFAYDQALANPSANYLAAPAQLAAIIETLEGDLFEPDPLVVTPGSP